MAVADAVAVAGFMFLALLGFFAIVGLLIFGYALVDYFTCKARCWRQRWEDHKVDRALRDLSAAIARQRYDERKAARLYQFPTTVERVDGKRAS